MEMKESKNKKKEAKKKKQIWNKPIRLLIDWYFTYSSTVETVKTEDWTVNSSTTTKRRILRTIFFFVFFFSSPCSDVLPSFWWNRLVKREEKKSIAKRKTGFLAISISWFSHTYDDYFSLVFTTFFFFSCLLNGRFMLFISSFLMR